VEGDGDDREAAQVVVPIAADGGEPDKVVSEVRAELAKGTSLRRIPTAQEVADVVVFLASPRAFAVTGDAVVAGGGERGVVHY
jgi:NAD(P)-dependent dehydrogenase (short-subunit alcohol dehydrogenase family)